MLPNSLSSVNNVEENADFNFKLLKAHHTWRSSSVSATVVLQITQKDNASDSMIRGVTTVETYWTSESLGELYQLAFEQAHQKYANQIGHYCASKGSIG